MSVQQIENDPQEFALYCIHQSGGQCVRWQRNTTPSTRGRWSVCVCVWLFVCVLLSREEEAQQQRPAAVGAHPAGTLWWHHEDFLDGQGRRGSQHWCESSCPAPTLSLGSNTQSATLPELRVYRSWCKTISPLAEMEENETGAAQPETQASCAVP